MKYLITILFLFKLSLANSQNITTYAGNGTMGYSGDGGQATAAALNWPAGVFADAAGNIFFADWNNYRIRKISPSGIITTIAGTGTGGSSGDGGPATAAKMMEARGIATDSIGNVYFVDLDTPKIRKVNTSGIISTIAGTGAVGYNGDGIPATSAQLRYPNSLFVKNGEIYFTDAGNYRIRKINAAGIISTIAGNGTAGYSGDGGAATAASFGNGLYATMDKFGNLYTWDTTQYIRKINPSGIISTIAGVGTNTYSGDNGPASAAGIGLVCGMATDTAGNLYFSDEMVGRVRRIDRITGIITTIIGDGTSCGFVGDGGPAVYAKLCAPWGVAIGKNNVLYFADQGNNRIRKVGSTLGVADVQSELKGLTITPNPAQNGTFDVNINAVNTEAATITITSITGTVIKTLKSTTNKAIDIKLDAPVGLYFVTVATAHGVLTDKVLLSW